MGDFEKRLDAYLTRGPDENVLCPHCDSIQLFDEESSICRHCGRDMENKNAQ
jgi:uncharacterized protein (DUF983 family)